MGPFKTALELTISFRVREVYYFTDLGFKDAFRAIDLSTMKS